MEQARQAQRGRAGWSALMERWSSSGLSVEEFCRLEGVNRSGFYRWRTLLASGSGSKPVARAPPQEQGAFVDLGALDRSAAENGRFELRLTLGGGVVLTLVRG